MRSIEIQFSIVIFSIATLTFFIGDLNYRSGFHALWILGIPILVAVLANKDAGSRSLMGFILTGCAPLVLVVTAEVAGIDY